jgi:ATP-binding protein involved in chromosome partitioning
MAYGNYGRIGRIIAVTSCKGGVGKSTVSFELASRLAARGQRVGLFDADVYGPSLPSQLPRTFGVSPSEDGWSMLPLAHSGLQLMSFGFLRGKSGQPTWLPTAEVDPRAAGDPGALAVQLLHTTAWGDLDYLVIDTPPGTGWAAPRSA